MKKSVLWVTSALVILALFAVAIFLMRPENRVYTENDAEEIIEIGTGEVFIIELKENPSTGYSWHYTLEPQELISLYSDQYTANETENLVGAAGKHEYVFKAMSAGNAQIIFDNYRSWEPDVVEKTYVFNVTVQ